MKNKSIIALMVLGLGLLSSCEQESETLLTENEITIEPTTETTSTEPHNYGGWYCPDNLTGFPAVDIADWKNVPVINGRMATKEETQSEASLIFVDSDQYPQAKPLDMTMPKLATIYNQSSDREELIIIIQAINVDNDSVVGFRYLNGGNGSAWLHEVNLISEDEVALSSTSKFVTHAFEIEAKQTEIWKILTDAKHSEKLRAFFDKKQTLKSDWRTETNVNFYYQNSGIRTAAYADEMYGCFYVQNDYQKSNYTEKFFLSENEESGITEFKIVCGPFDLDYEAQKNILQKWGQKVKELSEE